MPFAFPSESAFAFAGIRSLPAPKRFFLKFKGIGGDKRRGIQQLEIAATRGRYLRPFAKIMLALAALREKKPALAHTQLMELVAEFPENSLFVSELAKLDAAGPAAADGPLKPICAQVVP